MLDYLNANFGNYVDLLHEFEAYEFKQHAKNNDIRLVQFRLINFDGIKLLLTYQTNGGYEYHERYNLV